MADITNGESSEGDDSLDELKRFIDSRPDDGMPQSPQCETLPDDTSPLSLANADEADELAARVLDWMHENPNDTSDDARKQAWWCSVLPRLVAWLRSAIREMPPELPDNADLTTYSGIDELASRRDEITVLQEGTLIAMRTLMVLQIRDLHPSEYERTIQRIKDVIRRIGRELPIWRRQMKEGRISMRRLDAVGKAKEASTIYCGGDKQDWQAMYREMFRENKRITFNGAAKKIASQLGLDEKAVQTIRKHLSAITKKK